MHHWCRLVTALVVLIVAGSCYGADFTIDIFTSSLRVDISNLGNVSQQVQTTFSQLMESAVAQVLTESRNTSVIVDYQTVNQVTINVIAVTTSAVEAYPTWVVMKDLATPTGLLGPFITTAASTTFSGVTKANVKLTQGEFSIPCRSSILREVDGTPAPGACTHSLTFTVVYTGQVTAQSLQSTICVGLSFSVAECQSKLRVDSSTVAAERTAVFILFGVQDPLTFFLAFVDSVAGGKLFIYNAIGIKSILLSAGASGATTALVYSTTAIVNPNAPPDVMTCDPITYYWTLLFIIILPVAYIVARQVYHHGKKRSIAKEKKRLRQADGMSAEIDPSTQQQQQQMIWAQQQQQQMWAQQQQQQMWAQQQQQLYQSQGHHQQHYQQ